MLELLVAAVVLPTLIIALWNWLIRRASRLSWSVYRITGLIGTPVHELSHVLACLLFGMRICGLSLYSPNRETGTLGYVRFRFRPFSWFHAVGRVVQGAAPLITASIMLVMVLDLAHSLPHQSQGNIFSWIIWSAAATKAGVFDLLATGLKGWGVVTLLLVLSMHLIPSYADMQISIRGLIVALLVAGVAVAGGEYLWQLGGDRLLIGIPLPNEVLHYAGVAADSLDRALHLGVSGVVATILLAIAASTTFIVIPGLVVATYRFIRGATGDV